ncbi:recombinase family protein [Microbacterium alcoholitolerans]|uniref:recombinase family protein n=1 Tax=unclassified Microbacterium TaxID=2609290 RepID=UPI003D16D0FE
MTDPSQLVDLYLRLSVDRDGKDSLDRQEKDLRAWAKAEGLTVRSVWSDAGKSGYQKGVVRENFDNAILAITKGEVRTLAVWKLDRLSRRGAGQVGLVLDKIEDADGRLVFYKDNLDSTVQNSRLLIIMVSEQARAESANTSLRVSAKIASDAAKGLPAKGLRPFGWESGRATLTPEKADELGWTLSDDEKAHGAVYVPVRESEAGVIRDAYRRVLDGTASMWGLAREWTEAGYATAVTGTERVDRTRPTEKKKVPGVWVASTVRQTLIRPRNAGILVAKGVEMPVSRIEPIVTREEWESLTAYLANLKTSQPQKPGPKATYLLSGIIECACGERCYGSVSYSQRKGGPRNVYYFYMCRNRLSDPDNKHTSIKVDIANGRVMDDLVLQLLKGTLRAPDADALSTKLAALNAELADNAEASDLATEIIFDPKRKNLHKKADARLKVLETERAALVAQRDTLAAQRAEGGALGELLDQAQAGKIEPTYAGAMEWAQRFADVFREFPMEKKRDMIKALYRPRIKRGGRGADRIELNPTELITGAQPHS